MSRFFRPGAALDDCRRERFIMDLPVAIISGAGSGIGRAASVAIAKSGYSVVLAGRTAKKLKETADLVSFRAGLRSQVVCVAGDLAAPGFAGEVVSQAMKELGRIDALANVAGWATQALVAQTTPEIWKQTLDANLLSAAALTSAVWPHFEKQAGGVIVNVSSMAAIDPFPMFAAYASAKAALNHYTRVCADEGKDRGIRAVALAPGAVETPLLRSLFDEQAITRSQALSADAVGGWVADLISGKLAFESGGVLKVEPGEPAPEPA